MYRVVSVTAVALLLGVCPTLAFAVQSAEQTALEVSGDGTDVFATRAGLHVEEAPLSWALGELRASTGIKLAFSPSLLPGEPLVTCECTNVSVRDALERMRSQIPFGYAAVADQVVVKPIDQNRPLLRAPVFASIRTFEPTQLVPALPARVLRQTGSIIGLVSDLRTQAPVSAASVRISGTNIGTLTDNAGRFRIDAVPVGTVTVAVQRIGYQASSQAVTVTEGDPVVVNFELESHVISMDELVVTGVAVATPKSQLPFTVNTVDVPDLQPVPVSSAAGLIQARVPGAKVIQGSGQPGDEASIQLRGPTSIMGSQEPLVIVDGVITQGRLADVDPMDIATIEVVKGAAAASLYGSRAQAGVIEITTKRGNQVPAGRTEFTLRNMVQMNGIERVIPRNMHHPYRLTPDGSAFWDRATGGALELPATGGQFTLDDGGGGTNVYTTFADKPYPGQTWDPLRQFFNPGNFRSSVLSVTGNEGNSQYRASFRDTREEGIIRYHDGLTRRNFRLNVDHRFTNQLGFALSTYYVHQEQGLIESDRVDRGLRARTAVGPRHDSDGPLYRLTFLTPKANLGAMSTDPDALPGEPSVVGEQVGVGQPNPLYILWHRDWTRRSTRFMGSFDANYAPTSWLSFEGSVSYDRGNELESLVVPPGMKRPTQPPLQGLMYNSGGSTQELNASVTAALTHDFGDLAIRSRLRYVAESRDVDGFSLGGSNLLVAGTPRLGLLTGATDIDSYQEAVRSQGFFLMAAATYRDRYVLDLLGRRDGSSLFGPDERWQNYYRVSTAWRMAEESWWPFDLITEFKPRFSRGTAGGRPAFNAQYQTYEVRPGRIEPRILGNRALKPELATEHEFGIDMMLGQRFRIEANYVDVTVEDQLLLVPLPSFEGFEAQWQNAGTLASNTWEAGLEMALIERPGMHWLARVGFDRTTQKITRLDIAPFQIVDYRANQWVREGEPLGVFYGFKWIDDCSYLPSGTDCSQFQVNDLGHLVWVGPGNSWTDGIAQGLWGTTGELDGVLYHWGMPIRSNDPDNPDEPLVRLGSSQPDFSASLYQDIQWRKLGLTLLLDGEFGAMVYNQTAAWACRDNVCPDADQGGKPDHLKKPIAYWGTEGVYHRNRANSYWLQNGDFVKLRELSVRYTLNNSDLPGFLSALNINRAILNVSGRNLKTWTGYAGYDPEVGKSTFGGSAAVGRIDEYFYPNFRSFGVDLTLVF